MVYKCKIMKNRSVIDDIIISSDKIPPSIVVFPNGTLNDKHASQLKCGYYHDKKENVIGIANDRIVYKSCLSLMKKECSYSMLGIYNKRTGNMKLINTERWQVSPALEDQLNYDIHLNDDKTVLLNKQFGSKKTKRRAVQFGKMKINIEAVKDQLGATAKNTIIDKTDLSRQIPDQVASNIPPCNRDATSPRGVYNLNDIIPPEILELLISRMDQISTNNSEKVQFINTQALTGGESQRDQTAAIIEFMFGINRWLKINVRDAKKKSSEICEIPEVSNFIVDAYSMLSANGRTRPISMRDKAVIHSVILALMINDYQLDLEKFCENFSFSFGVKKLLELSKVVGTVSLKENKNKIVLKVPLPPKLTALPKSKRK